MALAASIFIVIGAFVLMSAVLGTRPELVDMIAGKTNEARSIWIIFGGGVILAGLFGVVGLMIGKRK